MSQKQSSLRMYGIVGGVIAGVAIALFAYLMFYTAPDLVTERVKLIANTPNGCIVETSDGFAVNVGACQGNPGDFIVASYDAKLKERAAMMNPTK